jgi:hypothetical protein
MEQHTLKKYKQLFEYQHLLLLRDISGRSYILYLNVAHFLTPVLIRYLWQLMTVVFLHWCLIHVVLFKPLQIFDVKSFITLVPGRDR